MNASDMESLKWYADGRANHGSRKPAGATARLVRDGFLNLAWTSRFDWCATITDKGTRALREQVAA